MQINGAGQFWATLARCWEDEGNKPHIPKNGHVWWLLIFSQI